MDAISAAVRSDNLEQVSRKNPSCGSEMVGVVSLVPAFQIKMLPPLARSLPLSQDNDKHKLDTC